MSHAGAFRRADEPPPRPPHGNPAVSRMPGAHPAAHPAAPTTTEESQCRRTSPSPAHSPVAHPAASPAHSPVARPAGGPARSPIRSRGRRFRRCWRARTCRARRSSRWRARRRWRFRRSSRSSSRSWGRGWSGRCCSGRRLPCCWRGSCAPRWRAASSRGPGPSWGRSRRVSSGCGRGCRGRRSSVVRCWSSRRDWRSVRSSDGSGTGPRSVAKPAWPPCRTGNATSWATSPIASTRSSAASRARPSSAITRVRRCGCWPRCAARCTDRRSWRAARPWP